MKWRILQLLMLVCLNSFGQGSGFKKDSLQIKVYTEIEYAGSRAKSIKVTKVFCDYCNDAQSNFLKKLAWRQSYDERRANRFRAKNGKAKLALFIRVDRKEFRRLRSDE